MSIVCLLVQADVWGSYPGEQVLNQCQFKFIARETTHSPTSDGATNCGFLCASDIDTFNVIQIVLYT